MTTSTNFASPNGLAMPTGGLAQRRGSQGIKPLSFDAIKQGNNTNDTGIPTPRTSRSHLLAGLRTAPKSATAASFGPASPTTTGPQQFARSNAHGNSHSSLAQEAMYNSAPKTAFPQYGAQHNQYQNMMNQQYTVDQVLAPPELSLDEAQEQMDPNLYAQLVATNMYLAQQQQRLQQQLRNVQAAAQQFQQLNLSNPHLAQQQMAVYEQQQQHLRNMQHQLSLQTSLAQAQAQAQVQAHAQAQVQAQAQQFYYNPMTGQYFVDTSAAQMASAYAEQPMSPGFSQQQQHLMMQQQQQQQQGTPRVQVSPPPEHQSNMFRSNSPPKRYESPVEVTPLPPPSANAFRRSHKKLPSVTPINSEMAANASVGEGPRSAGPKSALFPNPGGYGPGQARAGEHPIRQPRGPPSMDELKAKPTAKHEGSKNFASRTRRSAVHNLVRAGLVRRKGTGSSTGSMSPVSESAEEAASTPITDNESDSGRSGSGSLAGEMDSNSSRTSASGSWGAIGSDRPSSRQKARNSVDSATSGCESDTNSFAHVFKNGAVRSSKSQESADGQRKASRLVLTSGEKRKATPTAV